MQQPISSKINGFTQPFSFHQVISWGAIGMEALGFYCLYIPVLDVACQVIYSVVYFILIFGLFAYAFLCTSCDPTDPIVELERKARLDRKYFDTKSYNQVCTICKTHVLDHSKHCGRCDRCVNRFDHHCKWLNNCIGEKNYTKFAGCIGFLEGVAFVQTALGCYIIGSILNADHIYDKAKAIFFVKSNGVLYVTLVLATSFFAFVILVFNGHLIIFHLWLRKRGITTYDYVIMRRQRKQLQVKPQLAQPTPAQDETFDNTFVRVAEITSIPLKHELLISAHQSGLSNKCHSVESSVKRIVARSSFEDDSSESNLEEEVNCVNSV